MNFCHFTWAIIILSLSITEICLSCVLEERQALLNFKASINGTVYPDRILPSWIDDDDHPAAGSDCCYWEGVKCDVIGRIVELQLENLDRHFRETDFYESDRKCYSNLSILTPLENLQTLNLSYNCFDSSILEPCEGLASFKSLESLHFDGNKMGHRTLECLSAISSLKNVSLAHNEISTLGEINRLKQLQHLDMSHNLFSGPMSFKICSLKNLVKLDLSRNSFGGNVPLYFSNLTSLKLLDISSNNFNGTIPSLVITNLVHLEYISLERNHFEGSFSFGSFANLSKLQVFKLGDQNKEIYVNFDGLPLPPPFQLRVLYLVQCNLNNETRRIPDFLLFEKELRALDLSSNNLVGEFPNWLLENNKHLVIFSLRNNSFTGSFLGNGTLQDLLLFDISNNEVSGQVPQDVDLLFPSLEFFILSKNCFQGIIPESIGNWKMAKYIDLSHNNFSEEVPDRIGIGCVQLRALILSNNNFCGHFPSSSMNLTSLLYLHLDNNHFVGNISEGLSHSSFLVLLYISNNKFQGKIPSWIGNMPNLRALDLSGNMLEGTIPDDMCKLTSLRFLNLSSNSLNGSILSCSTLSALTFLHLGWNQFTGSIPYRLLSGSKDLITLDLRHNNLSGGISHDITALTELQVFMLGGNNLQGLVPKYICLLKNLNIIDLSHNNFSGRIPTCLNDISFGRGNFTSAVFQDWDKVGFYPEQYIIDNYMFLIHEFMTFCQEKVEFGTKSIISTYTGKILNNMSGIDLSCNQLTGEIPPELGDLGYLRALNLSQNYLQGSIPSRLSELNNIESLDLSYNNLSGQMPRELTNLHFLSVFNVSYNNLSGITPDQGQFANFDENTYRENPYLCGPLLQQHCGGITGIAELMHDVGEKYQNDGGIDMVAFFCGFFVSMGAALATLALSLYLSPEYRRVWFGLIDAWILFRFYRWYRSQLK